MNNMLNDFGAFIDSLRKSRNMSREDFIDGVISIRQYQRYVNGETSLNNDKLLKLIDKLGMNFFNIHKLYFKRNKDEIEKLNNIYGEISKDNLKEASELLEKVSIDDFNEEYNKSYYRLCILLLQNRSKKVPTTLIIDKMKKLIDYPNCLKNDIISFVEYVAYLEISTYSSENYDDNRILNYLFDKVINNNVNTDSILITHLPSTYTHITRRLGSIDEFEKALVIAQKGIDYCITYENHNSLAYLFYYKALSLKYLNKNDEALLTIKRLFALLYVEGKANKTKKFEKQFEKNFNMKVSEV